MEKVSHKDAYRFLELLNVFEHANLKKQKQRLDTMKRSIDFLMSLPTNNQRSPQVSFQSMYLALLHSRHHLLLHLCFYIHITFGFLCLCFYTSITICFCIYVFTFSSPCTFYVCVSAFSSEPFTFLHFYIFISIYYQIQRHHCV